MRKSEGGKRVSSEARQVARRSLSWSGLGLALGLGLGQG